jgi:hypothetical protein
MRASALNPCFKSGEWREFALFGNPSLYARVLREVSEIEPFAPRATIGPSRAVSNLKEGSCDEAHRSTHGRRRDS